MKTGGMVCLALAIFCGLPQTGRPDGCLMPSDQDWKQRRERALINEPDQKAMIYFRNGQEQLVISPSFDGAVGAFAWVVPVPARPTVEVLEGAPFHELARLVEPAPRYAQAKMSRSAAPSAAARPPVEVLERKTVGDYDVSVLASTDARALLNWLRANHYHLPAKAEGPMQSYIQERWTFVACRIKASASGEGLRTGTLTPLRLIFPASKPIYPMRLSAANPQPFNLLTYLVTPSSSNGRPGPRGIYTAIKTNTLAAWPTSAPRSWSGRSLVRAAILTSAQRNAFPTLAGLSRSNLDVYVLHDSFRPYECNQDFIWKLP